MSHQAALDLLETPPPDIALPQILAFLAREYGLHGTLTRLPSEKDLTFGLDTGAGRDWVVKIANIAEPPEALALQAAALDHLAVTAPDLGTARVRRTLTGEVFPRIRDEAGAAHIMLVVSYVPGAQIGGEALNAADAAAIGHMLAGLDRGLAGFTHPAAQRTLLWDHRRLPDYTGMMEMIADPAHLALARRALARYRAAALPHQGALRQQIVHNDFNPYNIMRDEAGRLGVIDFGDMLQAPLVQDLAVALAYLVPRGEGALGHAPSCVRAYGAMLPLTKLEQQLLPALTGARAALTLTIANWRAARNPHRADYILRNAPSAARALARLDAAGDEAAALLFAP